MRPIVVALTSDREKVDHGIARAASPAILSGVDSSEAVSHRSVVVSERRIRIDRAIGHLLNVRVNVTDLFVACSDPDIAMVMRTLAAADVRVAEQAMRRVALLLAQFGSIERDGRIHLW